MLHRVKKKHDLNEGKWIGVGGHVEQGETPDECVQREVLEETGLTLTGKELRGVVDFVSDRWEAEAMYLYTADSFEGDLVECPEGVLEWIPEQEIFGLSLWEGDRIFLNYLLEDEPFFHLRLHYDGEDNLVSSRRISPLILASSSPRREGLLCQAGFEPVVLPSAVEEGDVSGSPEDMVLALASRKAEACAASFHNGEVVIGADTVVALDGRVLGKPRSHGEAARMIRMLQGRTHSVYTGVCLIRAGGSRVSFAEKTEVDVAPMTEEEILLYAESDEPMDKAGAYGIQGVFASFIEGIRGDYYNVVGLPLHRVYEALRKMG